MGQIYTFNQTVIGSNHIDWNKPCEDCSGSYSSDDGRIQIAVIADGHGSEKCFRSQFGSKFAVDVTVDSLKKFAEAALSSPEVEERFYHDMLQNPRYSKMSIRQLTDTILARWHDKVMDDSAENPITDEEAEKNPVVREDSSKIPKAYGTTLIAALKLPRCLILLQQGDGRCDVFFENGDIQQPIPWDARCEGTSTTSLCDSDADRSIRHCVIDISENPVAACFVECDGVEDGYADSEKDLGGSHTIMSGVHTFNKHLLLKMKESSNAEFEEYIRVFFPVFSKSGLFSKSGSGDDVSVAGIIDLDSLEKLTGNYGQEILQYSLEDNLFWKEDELRSMSRKHGILKNRLLVADEELNKARQSLLGISQQLEKKDAEIKVCEAKAKQSKSDLEAYHQEAEDAAAQFGNSKFLAAAFQHIMDEIRNGYSAKEKEYRKMLEKLVVYNKEIQNLEEQKDAMSENISRLEAKQKEAFDNFSEYDKTYKSIEASLTEIKLKIDSLNNSPEDQDESAS